ncbi:uncharacterized protein A1O5_10540 [Cladophialophora psammophila CBS 110553]|uniref:Cyclohexanone monooxygenase n=1 Tax=Cladophialophora psammophila CBS 110553 TaxID=1182543 RepID=W9WEP3_9EURO|nr:uncharacterized protein A1O5_10540 [Cladophialophora psammophila CBS 110553]EXJ66388.1 hypothetical protein A1O5_10540 [Cladophialophora psammophila CBS 110553]
MPLIDEAPYTADDVPDYPQCTPQPIKIIHVGAGASGLLFAHKAEKQLQNYELICYEKNEVIGGTWYENRYPGCACDIPAHTYTYPFEPNAEWSGYYSYSHEIQEYFLRFAKKYGVEKYVQLNTEVVAATWDEKTSKWNVDLKRKDGSTFVDTCDVIVNGAGVINKWKWPSIEGLHDFKGLLAHSANWDTSIDWAGKTVAVIGTGSSSIQMVPKLVETAKHVTVFIRNETYIATPFGSISNKEADPEAQDPQAAGKHSYTEKEKQKFRDDPEYHLKYRQQVERSVASIFRMFLRGSEMNLAAKKFLQDDMARKLGDREDLKQRFIPAWSPGCRRLTPGEGYLEALIRDNVTCVFDDIVKVTPEGVVTSDGTEHKVDILACATGFYVAYLPHFQITGLNGQVMQDQKEPNVYASISAPGFPNYFVVNGPRGNWGQGCVLPSHEVHIEYILQCCRKMQEDGIRWMMPKQEPTTQLNLYMDAWHRKNSVWAEDCKSWYKDNKKDGRVYIWPGSLFHHLKFMKRPRFEHYDLQYSDPGNIFAFLGNGLTITETKYGPADLPVPYIRNNEDEAWDIE